VGAANELTLCAEVCVFGRGLQVLEFENVYLESLPSADMYERSFMHRDNVTQVVRTPTSTLPRSYTG
jgi:hypothetical protein